ncbi:MAG: LPS export ABC transporter periplasmic protein LptC [Luteimonas sp.]
MSWRTTITVLLLVAALLSGWSIWRNRAQTHLDQTAGSRPDYVLHDFDLVVLDNLGQESFTLRAPTMLRTPGERSMQMTTPVFFLPDSNKHYWRVSARTGWVAPGGEELRLRGDVRVASPPEQREVLMATEGMDIYPNRDLATSDSVVTITQPGSILSGRGLETNLATRQYQLKSEVHTRYVP